MLNRFDLDHLGKTINHVITTKDFDCTLKIKKDIQLSTGTATIYTMGENNPTIRIDYKPSI